MKIRIPAAAGVPRGVHPPELVLTFAVLAPPATPPINSKTKVS